MRLVLEGWLGGGASSARAYIAALTHQTFTLPELHTRLILSIRVYIS